MAFAIRSLSVLAYANGFTLWHYKGGADRLAAIAEPGFFSGASGMVATGDMIMISAADGGRVASLGQDEDGAAMRLVDLV